MVFNSIRFAIFFCVVFLLYWLFPKRQKAILVISNVLFIISQNTITLLLSLFIILMTYHFGHIINKTKSKSILIKLIIITCLPLFYFKSINENGSISPLGLSFYTLQAICYEIDLYKNRNNKYAFIEYFIYISMFPTFLSGPIESPNHIINQIKSNKQFEYNKISYGLILFLFGLFKKTVVADKIANIYVNPVFENVGNYSGFIFVLSIALYSIQLYCDFSGYSDMAIGIAKMLGYDLHKNFSAPYFSSSVKEFWSRWHISLSTWLKNYIYIPLGGNRKGKFRKYINIVVVFVLSGMWHGIGVNYIIWGLLHAAAQILEDIFKKSRFKNVINKVFVFIFVSFTWIFFRATSINDSLWIINNMFDGISNVPTYLMNGLSDIGFNYSRLAVLLLGLIIVIATDVIEKKTGDYVLAISSRNVMVRWSIYIVIGFMIVYFSQKGVAPNFVYSGF